MAKLKGSPKSGGRKKGSKNKENPVRAKAKELGIDPWEVLLYFVAGDWKSLGYASETFTRYGGQGVTNEEFTIQPSVRQKAAAEACQYIHPKLKAIEHSGSLDGNITQKTQLIILPANGREKK